MKKIINTINAPAPIGPYNQAVLLNGILYTSGQIAIHPATNELVIDEIKKETKMVMENLKSVLAAADMTMEDVVKTTIFISNMNNFAQINEIYGSYFTSDFPARETVEVSCLPKNVNVENSVVASK
jgi:2-iminobutanoate/2-iminopropanoate deaminase